LSLISWHFFISLICTISYVCRYVNTYIHQGPMLGF
jgi:hypothetical protein